MAFNKTLESEWSFKNFQSIEKNVGAHISSPDFSDTFNNKSFKWRLDIYPTGRYEQFKDWLSVYINIISNNGLVAASVSLSIVNNNKKIIQKSTKKTNYDTKYFTYCGFGRFAEHDFVIDPANGVLNNNNLTIKFNIKLYGINEDAAIKVDKSNENNILRLTEFNEFEMLIDEQQFSDVSFIVEGKTVRAHKCILARRSSVFAAMFQHKMKESLENKVEIEDIKHDNFVELLRFIYAGKVNGIENIAGELLAAADKYAIDGLKVVCARALSESLSVDNVITNVQLADKYNLKALKEDAIDFVVLHKTEIDEKPEFELLMEMPQVLFALCKALMHDD